MSTHPLTAAREAKGWSRYGLAKEADVHQSTVAYIEEGQVEPTLPTLRKLARALGVPVTRILPPEKTS
jgi:transcriptional regulator with XRE-family HTH domain